MNNLEAIAAFRSIFDHAPAYVVRSPGRVNLIGDHTDYTGGLVLPMAIDRNLFVAASRANDDAIHVHSASFSETAAIPFDEIGSNTSANSWIRYVVGVAAMLQRSGIALHSANLWIGGNLPIGAGLASSAALEVGVAQALLSLSGKSLSPTELAILCQQAEHEFAGSPCGIMDQLCCTMARAHHALLIDCNSLATTPVPLPWESTTHEATEASNDLEQVSLTVIDTGVRHSIAGEGYAERRRECSKALDMVTLIDSTTKQWVDLQPGHLDNLEEKFAARDEGLLFRRTRHIVTENARVRTAVEALLDNDMNSFGRLMSESHQSLRDDFAVSCQELDRIVDTALATDGVLGARMTGGGFGGCAIVLLKNRALSLLNENLALLADPRLRIFIARSADAAHTESAAPRPPT